MWLEGVSDKTSRELNLVVGKEEEIEEKMEEGEMTMSKRQKGLRQRTHVPAEHKQTKNVPLVEMRRDRSRT